MSHAVKAAAPRAGPPEATAAVFHVAFRALPKEARDQFLALLLHDEDLRDHVEGALLWEDRKNEPRIPFAGLLKKSRARAR